MDLTQAITYRSTNINLLTTLSPGAALSGALISDVNMPEVEGWGYKEKRSLDDGYDFNRVYLGARVVQMRGTIYGLTLADLHDRVRTVRRLFTPTLCYAEDPENFGFLPLDFSWPTEDTDTWSEGLIPVRLYVRPEDQPGFNFARAAHGGGDDARGYSVPYQVTLVARDPRFYLQTTEEVAVAASSGSGTATNDGDYPAPVNAIFGSLAASSGPRTVTFTGFGSVFTVTIPDSSQDRNVVVDGEKKVCTLVVGTTETLRMDLIEFAAGYTWPKAQPGDNVYDWTTTGGAPDTGSKVWFRPAFV